MFRRRQQAFGARVRRPKGRFVLPDVRRLSVDGNHLIGFRYLAAAGCRYRFKTSSGILVRRASACLETDGKNKQHEC